MSDIQYNPEAGTVSLTIQADVSGFIRAIEAADENLAMACDWSDFRKDYGVSSDPEVSSREHRAFKAGWKAGRHGDQSGALR